MNKSYIRAIVPIEKIGFIGWVFEGYECVGLVSTVDHLSGEIVVRTTMDMYDQALNILNNLPFNVQLL